MEMKLAEMRVDQFSETLASDAPAPGGGSAAALEAALGAGLVAMVCRLTQEKAQFARYRAELLAVQTRAEALRYALLDVMDRDTEAFLQVSRAFPMPKSTEEEKAARSAAIQKGLELCTQTPLEIMKLAAEALDLAASLLGRFNENAASDLGVAVLSLQAGLRGAWLNVCINIGSLRDKALAQHCREEGEALLAHALPLAERVSTQVEDVIREQG
jgi:formiminotetrahydrofolate cyclodeaminase